VGYARFVVGEKENVQYQKKRDCYVGDPTRECSRGVGTNVGCSLMTISRKGWLSTKDDFCWCQN